MSLLALPYYPSTSLENKRIRIRVRRNGKKMDMERRVEKGIYTLMKKCPKCNEVKHIDEFIKNSQAKKTTKCSYCISCRVIFNKKYGTKEANKKYWHAKRIKAYRLIQNRIECIRCGCNDIRFLEINHKVGKHKHENPTKMYCDITSGRRHTYDLELLCRPCNHIHYLEMKYGEKIGLKVVWSNT